VTCSRLCAASEPWKSCRATIEKLRKDNLSLKEELYLENKFSITPLDSAASHRITAMQDEADALTRKVHYRSSSQRARAR
jgi:hypothetical protein